VLWEARLKEELSRGVAVVVVVAAAAVAAAAAVVVKGRRTHMKERDASVRGGVQLCRWHVAALKSIRLRRAIYMVVRQVCVNALCVCVCVCVG